MTFSETGAKLAAPSKPISAELAAKIVEGAVVLLSIDDIVTRLGVSRSTLERWIRNSRSTVLGTGAVGDVARNVLEGKTNFPQPDVYIGSSPRWAKETVISWVQQNGTKT